LALEPTGAMGGKNCTASGGAPFHAQVTLINGTRDLTLKELDSEACKRKCEDFGCDRKHHLGLYMVQGKVPANEQPAAKVEPLESMTFGISARENSACGPEGELNYEVWRDGQRIGSLWLSFARDANSSTRSCNCSLSGEVNAGEYELLGRFPPDTIQCTFELRKRKVEVRMQGQFAGVPGGGHFDMVVPIEDIFKVPQLQALVAQVADMNSNAERLVALLQALQREGVKIDLVSQFKPSWWPL